MAWDTHLMGSHRTPFWGRTALSLLTIACLACGGGGSGNGNGDGGPDGDDAGSDIDASPPEAVCDAPALYDVSSPTTVVGNGSPASCTGATLQTAADAGGTIVFDCGAAPVTIDVDTVITVSAETVIDGGDLVTLSGGGQNRILYLDSNYNTATPRLVVQRLSFTGGQSPAEGEDTAQGGGAIYRDGGSLTVIDCAFDDNHGPLVGQDVAGGAIYGFGGGDIIISGSLFTNNSASDGGAIGSLNGDLTVINTTLSGNAATGTGGNPGTAAQVEPSTWMAATRAPLFAASPSRTIPPARLAVVSFGSPTLMTAPLPWTAPPWTTTE